MDDWLLAQERERLEDLAGTLASELQIVRPRPASGG
jgi:hypothetical protein